LLISLLRYPCRRPAEDFHRIIDQILQRPGTAALALIGLSTLQRVIAIALQPVELVPGDDPLFYWTNASRLLGGEPFWTSHSPLMTYVLAGSRFVFGETRLPVQLLLLALGSLALCRFYEWLRIVSRSALSALLGLLLFLFANHWVFFQTLFWNENLFVPLLVFWIADLRRASASPRFPILSLTLVGLWLGLLILCRSWPLAFAGLVPLALAGFFASSFDVDRSAAVSGSLGDRLQSGDRLRRCLMGTMVVCVVAASVVAPHSWMVSAQQNRFILSSENGIYNLVVGNAPGSSGVYDLAFRDFAASVEKDPGDPAILGALATFARNHPGRLVKQIWRKALHWPFGGGGNRWFDPYYMHPQSLAMYFARMLVFVGVLAGLILGPRGPALLIGLLYFGIYAIHVVFIADHRLTVMATPLEAAACAWALAALLRRAGFADSVDGLAALTPHDSPQNPERGAAQEQKE